MARTKRPRTPASALATTLLLTLCAPRAAHAANTPASSEAANATQAVPERANTSDEMPEGAVARAAGDAEDGDMIERGDDLFVVKDGFLYPVDEASLFDLDPHDPGAEKHSDPATSETRIDRRDRDQFSTTTTGSYVDRGQQQAVATDVVDSGEVAETGGRTLSDALTRMAGVQVSQGRGTGETLTIDGLDGKYVLILIDGRPIGGKVNDRVDVSRLPISPADVARIEVVRGPMSAVYGSEALGGVVNIITKNPKPGWAAQADLSARADETGLLRQNLSGSVSGATRLYRMRLSGTMGGDRGFDRGGRDGPNAPDGRLDVPHRRQGSVSGEMALYPSVQSVIRAYGNYFWNALETQLNPAEAIRDASDARQMQLGAVVERALSPDHKLAFEFRGDEFNFLSMRLPSGGQTSVAPFCEDRTNGGGVRFWDEACPAATNTRSDTTQTEGRVELRYTGVLLRDAPLARKLSVAAGLQGTREYAERLNKEGENTIKGASRGMGALYAEAVWQPTENIKVVPGLRATGYARLEDGTGVLGDVSPKLSARVALPAGFALRGSVGRGFRAPSFQELYLTFDHSELGYIVSGNDAVLPERSSGVRGELTWSGGGAELGLEGFANMLDGQITEVQSGQNDGGIPIFTYDNIARSSTAGLNVRLSSGTWNGFSASLGYQYLAIANNAEACPESNPYFCSAEEGATSLPLRPIHSATGRIGYAYKPWGTRVFGLLDAQSDRAVAAGETAPGFMRLTVGARQTLGDKIDLMVSVGNLTDAYDAVYGPKPGRHLNVALSGRL